jgi:hypothetical protein
MNEECMRNIRKMTEIVTWAKKKYERERNTKKDESGRVSMRQDSYMNMIIPAFKLGNHSFRTPDSVVALDPGSRPSTSVRHTSQQQRVELRWRQVKVRERPPSGSDLEKEKKFLHPRARKNPFIRPLGILCYNCASVWILTVSRNLCYYKSQGVYT